MCGNETEEEDLSEDGLCDACITKRYAEGE
jgi:hypothetical protein